MKVYKRDGKEVDFCLDKIKSAIDKANKSTFSKFRKEIVDIYTKDPSYDASSSEPKYETLMKITDDSFDWNEEHTDTYCPKSVGKDKLIKEVSKYILVDGTLDKVIETTQKFLKLFDTVTVEDISDLIERSLMKHNSFEVAKEFITYRDNKRRSSKFTDTELKVLSVIDGTNEELRGDNANKHIDLNSSARDYIAGTVCKSIADKILPADIAKAHKEGYIHWHDKDYSPVMHMTNCGLVNVEDMVKNGSQMGDLRIDSPRKASTSGNIFSQFSLIVSGQQYGGQTMTISAMLPVMKTTRVASASEYAAELLDVDYRTFSKCESVDEVYNEYRKRASVFSRKSRKLFDKIVEKKTRHDVHVGIKTYAWQILCHHSSNGQSPFTSLVLNLREAESEQEQKDLAFLIEEVLDRRIKGVTGANGKSITPLFPKLLYWTCDGLNVNPEDPYYYLTKKAAKCITMRMAPDINSEKMCRKIKNGQWIPSMGCVDGSSIIKIKYNNNIIEDSFEKIWELLSKNFDIKDQFVKGNPNKFIDLADIEIWDNVENKFVKCFRIIKNSSKKWIDFKLVAQDNETLELKTTEDHVFTDTNKTDIFAKDFNIGGTIFGGENGNKIFTVSSKKSYIKEDFSYDVTTSSEHFMVNNLYSHNCRSLLSALWIEKTYPKDTKFHWQEVGTSNVQFDGAPGKNFDYSKGFGNYSPIPNDIAKGVVINFRGNSGWVKSLEEDTVTVIEPRVFGRWNNGVVTINIPQYAGEAREKVNKLLSKENDITSFINLPEESIDEFDQD